MSKFTHGNKYLTDEGAHGFWTAGFVMEHANSNSAMSWQPGQNTVIWSTDEQKMEEDFDSGELYWGKDGPDGRPQPDNYAFRMDPTNLSNREMCVAVKAYKGTAKLHDSVCEAKFPVVCEPAPPTSITTIIMPARRP